MIYVPPAAPLHMHAPDGFFSVALSVCGWLLLVGIITLALRNTRDQLGDRQIPLMGVLAAAIFAGQMLNFTIPGGTSGHLLGGALAAIILGPWAAVLVLTSVIAVQALLFQDGGLVVMSLNIINMGVITSFVGYFAYKGLSQIFKGKIGVFASSFVAGWVSIVITSAFVAVELALSGTSSLGIALPAMLGVHAMIGVGEGLLTAFALGFIRAVRPDVLTAEAAPGQRSAGWIAGGLVIALALTLLAPLASPYADGLENVMQVLNPTAAQAAPFHLLPNYAIPGLTNGNLSTILAGMIGVMVVFGAALILARFSKREADRHEQIGL